ncbi:MAG: hypothetical protein IKC27_00885 [Kiritimatiellae bacterium]|nr:hypothetical protein [Kiritimatiellia bacterium]
MEFLPEQERVQRDFVRWDADNAEFVEEQLSLFSELFSEYVIWSFATKRRSRIAVEVRHNQIDLLLGKRVERDAFLEDAPELQMKAFDMRFLSSLPMCFMAYFLLLYPVTIHRHLPNGFVR